MLYTIYFSSQIKNISTEFCRITLLNALHCDKMSIKIKNEKKKKSRCDYQDMFNL